jgi:hypothetical protein
MCDTDEVNAPELGNLRRTRPLGRGATGSEARRASHPMLYPKRKRSRHVARDLLITIEVSILGENFYLAFKRPVTMPIPKTEFHHDGRSCPVFLFTLSSLSGASFGVRWHAVRGGIARPADRMACHARVTDASRPRPMRAARPRREMGRQPVRTGRKSMRAHQCPRVRRSIEETRAFKTSKHRWLVGINPGHAASPFAITRTSHNAPGHHAYEGVVR